MIRGIRRKFIRIALAVLAVAMALVTAIINTANWVNVRSELWDTMNYLVENGGQRGRRGGGNRHMRNMLDESLYFTVFLDGDADGATVFYDRSRIAEEDAEETDALVAQALQSGRTSGFCRDHLFSVGEQRGGRVMIFLNCETKLTRVRNLALISAAACLGCVLLAWLLVALFSSRAIRPLVENAVMQKQFITDAGHELKTPLTVISANMDVLALEAGDSEWIASTRKQVANLRGLVGELIYLSRLDEEDARLSVKTVDLTAAVREAAEPFAGMAEFAGKSLTVEAEAGVKVRGDESALKRLVSILCDNAVKYAPEGDGIRLTLRRDGRSALLVAENGLEKPMDAEVLRHLFDRFYRADASRSRERGGYGIGLSVARAVAEKHGGTLRAAQTKAGRIRFICRLPARQK